MTIGTIFIVPSLYVLIARTHNEGAAPEPADPTHTRDRELVPEFAGA